MNDEEKTKEQLIEELNAVRMKIDELEEKLVIEKQTVKVMSNREFRIEELRRENMSLKNRIEELKKENERLSKKIAELERVMIIKVQNDKNEL